MTIFQLECYLALSQSLNFTHVAAQKFITQPALSRSMSALEKEIGIELINRSANKIALTPAGKVFAEECKNVIDSFRNALHKTVLSSDETHGQIRLGLPIDSYEPLAAKLVQAMANTHQGVDVELKFYYPTALIRALDEELVDVVIASGVPRRPDIKSLVIDKRKNYATLPLGHSLANRESIKFDELKHDDFLVISKTSSKAGYNKVISLAVEHKFTPSIVGEAESVSALLMQVACGKGVSVLYKEHAPASHGQVAFVELEKVEDFERFLLWRDGDNKSVDKFVDIAKELYPK